MPVIEVSNGEGQESQRKLKRYISEKRRGAPKFPTIAQLVERPTVVDKSQPSDGPWFESGLSDLFYCCQSCMGVSVYF